MRAIPLFLLLFLWSCEKPIWNTPKADFALHSGYIYRLDGAGEAQNMDTIACCYENFIESKCFNTFSEHYTYLCSAGNRATILPNVKFSWNKEGVYWIRVDAKDNDGVKTHKTKYYYVR